MISALCHRIVSLVRTGIMYADVQTETGASSQHPDARSRISVTGGFRYRDWPQNFSEPL